MPLAEERLDIKYVIGVNFLSVIIGAVVPSAGAVDIAIKLKYMTKESKLTYEKIFSTIVAVRVIFLITLYPTIAIFLYIIYASGILSLKLTLGLLIIVWILLTVILGLLILVIVKVDVVNENLLPMVFFPLKRYEKFEIYNVSLSKRQILLSNHFAILKSQKNIFIGLFSSR